MDSWHELDQADLDSEYSVQSSRDCGERILAHMAMYSLVEYAWEFDPEQSLWHHFDGSTRYEAIEEDRSRIGFHLANRHLIPIGQRSTMYHFHPEKTPLKFKPLVPIRIQNQLPSSDDVATTIKLIHHGYKDAKIVTISGVTTISTEHPDKFRVLPLMLKGLRIESNDIQNHLASNPPFDKTIGWLFDQFNEHYKGDLVFSYQHFTQTDT